MRSSNELKRIADLDAYGIIREASKLFRAHAEHFFSIQLTLTLPITVLRFSLNYILLLTVGYVVQLYRLKHLPQAPSPPPDANSNLPSFESHERLASANDLSLTIVVYAVVSAVMIFSLVAQALSDSAILYSVGLIYTAKQIAFSNVVHAAMTRLWTRLTATYLYLGLLAFFTIVLQGVQTLFQFAGYEFTFFSEPFTMFLMMIVVLSLGVISIYLQMIRMVASGVSTLEEHYGRAATNKAMQLVKGKQCVALLFQSLWSCLSFITYLFQGAIILHPQNFYVGPTWSLLTVICIVWMTFLSQMGALCAGVQYASFKAHHNEIISDFGGKGCTLEGHELVGIANDQGGQDNTSIQRQYYDSLV